MLNDPTISVTCDACGDTIEDLELTPLAGGGWDARNIESVLSRYKWVTDGDQHICDDCASRPESGQAHRDKE